MYVVNQVHKVTTTEKEKEKEKRQDKTRRTKFHQPQG
jgi:hypothetical protein